jgi:hypothetical protein
LTRSHLIRARCGHGPDLASRPHPPLHGNGVDLKRVPPKSRPAATAPGSILGSIPRWKRPARTPPSTFLFLPIHLSNSPGPQGPSLRTSRRAAEAYTPDKTHRRLVTVISEELRRRAIAPSGGAPCVAVYRRGPRSLSTMSFADFRQSDEIVWAAGLYNRW